VIFQLLRKTLEVSFDDEKARIKWFKSQWFKSRFDKVTIAQGKQQRRLSHVVTSHRLLFSNWFFSLLGPSRPVVNSLVQTHSLFIGSSFMLLTH
jgi:hypothetical protein